MKMLTEIPENEIKEFDLLIKKYRSNFIRTSQQIIDHILENNQIFVKQIKEGTISECINELRELAWHEFLKDEVEFNAILMRDLHKLLDAPKDILDVLLEKEILSDQKEDLLLQIKEICGEYAGRVFPYIYRLSLSNTQSRRSRSGKTFEAIIYKIYEELNYSYDSQSKVGRKTFDSLGLGKKVDSILPGVEAFSKRRNKTIVGTMKTSLRERWQEVAEEIERTKIPEIHLLTVDEDISLSKAKEMSNHNIVLVTYKWISDSEKLKYMKNIISFENYMYEEIPNNLNFWKDGE